MNVSIGERWEGFVDSVLKAGRYGSASEVVREGLPLVEEREAKLQALRETLDASITRGGAHDDDAIGGHVDAALDQWKQGRHTYGPNMSQRIAIELPELTKY